MSAAELFDTGFVDIDADNFIAGFCEAGGCDEADVAGTEDADVHKNFYRLMG